MHASLLNLAPGDQTDTVWSFNNTDEAMPDVIQAVTRRFNGTDYLHLLEPLHRSVQKDERTGIDYVWLRGDNDSADTAVVHFNPFANGMSNNMLVRARYCKEAFDSFGIYDEQGCKLPMVTFAAPSGNKDIKLDSHHHRKTAKGEFDGLARLYMHIVQKYGFKKLRIVGFSQGATMAAAAALVAHEFGFQVTHLAIGEPANVMKRSKSKLALDFLASERFLRKVIRESTIIPHQKAHKQETRIKYNYQLLQRRKLNYNLLRGLAKDTFISDLDKILHKNILVTLSYGDITSISPSDEMKKIVSEMRRGHDKHHHLQTIEISNAHHAWSDQLHLLALFYSYGISR